MYEVKVQIKETAMKLFKISCLWFGVLCSFMSTPIVAAKMSGSSKTFLFTLPLTWGSPLHLSYNYDNQFAIGLEVTGLGDHERLSERERKEAPGSSLLVKSGEIGLMMSRFSRPEAMAGWYWGLGLGYKALNAAWTKTPKKLVSSDGLQPSQIEEPQKMRVLASGNTITGKFGYRFVGSELGFVASLSLIIKHFQNRVKDAFPEEGAQDEEKFTAISRKDKETLRKRLTTQAFPAIEIGWAF